MPLTANGGAQVVSSEVSSASIQSSSGAPTNGEARMVSHEVAGSSGVQASGPSSIVNCAKSRQGAVLSLLLQKLRSFC